MELSPKEMGEYLKSLRENKGLSTREVYELSKVSNSYLSLVENGHRRASAVVLKKLAPVYGVDYLDLYVKAGYVDLIGKDNFDHNIQVVENKSEGSAVVLIYGTIPAGTPMEMIEDIIDTEEIPIEYLKGGKEYFGLKIKGNSMETKYLDGDIIICEKVDDCESGKDAVVMVNGYDGTFKRIFKDPEKQTIRLQPLNTSLDAEGKPLYEAKTYTKEEIERLPVKIIGRAVEVRRKL